MGKRKKILVLTPRYPFPLIGGDKLRIYNICKELSKFHDITLLSLSENRVIATQKNLIHPEAAIFKKVEVVFQPRWKSYLNCLFALPSKLPLQIAYYHSEKFKAVLHELEQNHDIILSHLIRTTEYVRQSSVPKILEMTDAISLNYERVAKISKLSGLMNIVYSFERSRLEKYEKAIVDCFDYSVLVSQIDKSYLDKKVSDSSKLVVCPNGVDIDIFPYNYDPYGNTIVFIGNLTTVQNLDAAFWFAQKVLPKLRQKGDFEFKVIGPIQHSKKVALKKIPGVTVTGKVKSISESVQNAIAGVCPMRIGAGIQNKVLEYMALGIPCVSSPLSSEGLDAKSDEEILIADTPDEYVSQLLKVKNDRVFAAKISINAREYVVNNHAWSECLSGYLEVVERLNCKN